MNPPDHKFWGLMALILLCCAGIWVARQPSSNDQMYAGEALLAGVPAPEIPTAAVRKLQEVSPVRRLAMISQMMLELEESQPGMLPFFIASVSREFPEAAPWLLVEALGQQPDQTVACVRAACAAVPDQVEVLVAECVKNLPDAFPLVALTAAQERPEKTEAIWEAIGKALPETRPALELAFRRQRKFPVDVWEVLMETDRMMAQSEGYSPGENENGMARGGGMAAGETARHKVGKPPFAALQQVAQARHRRQLQPTLCKPGTDRSVQPGRPAALTKGVDLISENEHGDGTLKEADSRAEGR